MPATGEIGTASATLAGIGGLIEAQTYDYGSPDYTDAKVFFTILVLDKNNNLIDVVYQQVVDDDTWNWADISYTAKEEVNVYMYISSEDNVWVDVYIDNVAMTYTPSRIIQSNEYYPFGLQTAKSWTRQGTAGNQFLYNRGSELNSTTGFYDLPYRNYEASLGRFFQVDPLAHVTHNLTPYHYAGNNPISVNDPTGLLDVSPNDEDFIRKAWNGNGGTWSSDAGAYYFSAEEAEEIDNFIGSLLADTGGGGGGGGGGSSAETDENGQLHYYVTRQITTDYYSSIVDENGYTGTDVTYERQEVSKEEYDASQGGNSPLDGFINIQDFKNIVGNVPNYRGVFISVQYYEGDTKRFSDYNWKYRTSFNGSPFKTETDPNNFINQGPFYYGPDVYNKAGLGDNNLYDASEFPTMNFLGEMKLFGKEGDSWTEIGTVNYGFNYGNNVITPIAPTITYK